MSCWGFEEIKDMKNLLKEMESKRTKKYGWLPRHTYTGARRGRTRDSTLGTAIQPSAQHRRGCNAGGPGLPAHILPVGKVTPLFIPCKQMSNFLYLTMCSP